MQAIASKSMAVFPILYLTFAPLAGQAATPAASDALTLTPLQDDAVYQRPSPELTKRCTIEAERTDGANGWVVRDPAGRVLRRFVDTNSDRKVDRWCYYKNGVEVYRDIDADFNGKADQYRWLGTAGIRWGLDADEDGEIDSWKMISAEEVTAEVVAALRDKDLKRFRRLLLSKTELHALGLGERFENKLAVRLEKAEKDFLELARNQTLVKKNSTWIHFGASRPGVLPAGTDGSEADLIVYDNVSAVVETDGKHGQVIVGTLVQAGPAWRLIDLPHSLSEQLSDANSTGILFTGLNRNASQSPDKHVVTGVSETVQELMSEYEKADRAISTARTSSERAKLLAGRADILERLIDEVESGEERANWIRQYADTVSAAVQEGNFDDGLKRLDAMYKKLAQSNGMKDMAGYVMFRYLSADYSKSLNEPNADYAKVQQKWLKSLGDFVQQYPTSSDAADAMLQLALAEEFAGEDEKAKIWYQRIIREFPKTELANKAAGAVKRLESVGKTVELQGRSVTGSTVDLTDYRGKVVVIHYWSTWCEPCKDEFKTLKNLYAKYSSQGLKLIGVSLDSDRDKLTDYLRTNSLPWPQLHEEGGLDSRYANELGILTLPTMFLIDSSGKVVRRNVHAGELDAELRKLLR